jgi:positive phototaxis protein PixI
MVPDLLPVFDFPLSSSALVDRSLQEQFLRCYLVPDTTVMLPVSQLNEVLTIPIGQIIPIPHMPGWVMGIYNWRGEILWMVDLGHLVGLTPWHQQMTTTPTYKAIVLHNAVNRALSHRERSQAIGLIVSQVEDIEWCNPQEIQSPPSSAVTPGLAPYLRGYWLKSDGEMIVTLDGESILAAMPKA